MRFWGYQKWHIRSPKRKSETTFIDQIPPLNLGKITLGTHFCHSKVVFWPFYTFCTFYTNLLIRNDKIINFQLKFHPAKQNVINDLGLPMESSWSPLSKNAITFKFMIYLSMVLDCQRKKWNFSKMKKSTEFQVKFHPAKNFRWPPKFFPLVFTYQKPP